MIQQSWISWLAMLKMTGVKLGVITNVNIYQFIKKVMRERVSYVTQRYSKANNRNMKFHNKAKPFKYIIYEDANN